MTYRAIQFKPNPNESVQTLSFEQERLPLAKGYVRIKIGAFALNRADVLQAQGKYPPPEGESNIPGLEFAGHIIESNDHHLVKGTAVMALVGSGAYAEECVVHASLVQEIPKALSIVEAAALPEALTTVHATVFKGKKPKDKQRILMHGAASGISTLAAQMLSLAGMQASICGRNLKKIQNLPAYPGIAYHLLEAPEDLVESRFGLYDRIVDILGGRYTKMHLDLLKPTGELLQMACVTGGKSEIYLPSIMRKRLKLTGFVLRSQSIAAKAKLFHQACAYWLALEKPPTPLIDRIFHFSELDKALQRMARSEHIGKIVVKVD